jgi:gamma-glutamylcyclotransferase (GGCT)/AIG2-like uncharacterized protein YtfP
MSAHVFTYGSLMFPEVWARVVKGDYRSVRGALRDHARFAVRDQDYPGMVAQPGARVDGVLYLDVEDADLARLDHFEGDDYRRLTVDVAGDDGVVRVAQTYLYGAVDRLLSDAWQVDTFAMQRFIDTYCRDKLEP